MRKQIVAVVLATLPAVFFGMWIRVWVVYNDAPLCGSQAAAVAPMCLGPYSDAAVMGALSAGVFRGQGFSDPLQPLVSASRATSAPVLPLVLGVADLLGFSDLQSKRAFAGLVGALGAMTVGGVAMALDRRSRGGRPAVAAVSAGIVAFAPFWVIDGAMLRPEILLVPIVALLLWRLVSAGNGTSTRAAIIDGVVLAGAVLTRADGVVLMAAALVGLALHVQGRSGTATMLRSIGVTVATLATFTLPWLLFNFVAGSGFTVAERGVFDAASYGYDQNGNWGSLVGLGWMAQGCLLVLGVTGAVRRAQRVEVVWPFGLFASVSIALVAVVGLSSGPLIFLDVAAVVLAGPMLVDGALAGWRVVWPYASVVIGPVSRVLQGSRRRLLIGLLLVFVASAGIRLWIVNVQRPVCPVGFDITRADQCWALGGDASVFIKTARAVSNGDGFMFEGRQSAAHPPMFTLVLAAADFTGNNRIEFRRNLMALVGAGGVVVITVIAYRLARTARLPAVSAAAWTAGIAAVYPAFWLSEAMLYSESLLLLTGSVVLLISFELFERPSVWWGAALGGALGIAALTRAEVMVFAVPVGIIYVLQGWRSRRWKAHVVHMLVAALTLTAVLSPWVAYNRSRFSKPVAMTTTPGATLVEVTCDEVFYGDLLGYYNLACLPVLIMLHPDESVADARAMDVATRYLRRNAGQYPVQVVAATARMTELYRPAQNANLSARFEVRGFAGSFSAVFAHLMILPFALVGVVALRRRRVALAPFAGAVLSVVVAVAFIGAIARMRLMVDISIVLLAGVGLAWLHQFLWSPKDSLE